MAAGPHRRFDGLEVRARLRIEQPRQPGHPVESLRTQVQTAAAGPILIGEEAIGIEVIANPLTQFGDDASVNLRCMRHEGALGVR